MNNTEAKTASQAQMLANRLQKRLRHLHKWAKRCNIGAFRLYDRDIPEIPLVLDLYGDVISGALYKRPYEKDETEEAAWLEAMQIAIAQSLSLERDNIIIKHRERQRRSSGSPQTQYEKRAAQNLTRIISEGELRFKVNLSDYLDTGLFLDRRAMRRMVNADSKGKRVLNLFCYTGSFSLAAADGGAASTDSVDLSNTYLNWARENLALNGFSAKALRLKEFFTENKPQSCAHRLVRSDASAFLHRAAKAGQRWDSIVLDPPVFSNSTMADDFDLNRDYKELLKSCLALLASNGKLWFSASARSFKASAAKLETALKEHYSGLTVTDISDQTIDEDFKGKKRQKAFCLNHKKFINELH